MKLRRKIKRSTKQYITVAFICIVMIGGAAALTTVTISGQVRDKYTALLKDAHREMEDNQKIIYVAQADILTGTYITQKNIMLAKSYTSQPKDTFISSEDIGKVALVDITKGTQILKGMLTDNSISPGIRELEYSVIHISSNIENNNTVDVRISYPNGESYVVLSKKLVKGYVPGTAACYFWMDEAEILRMSAAIVDAGLYEGSRLFVTKYIEPNIQEASAVNYIPSISIQTLLENDPNILEKTSQKLSKEVRKALENRLAESLKADVSTVSWEVEPEGLILTPAPTPQPNTEDSQEAGTEINPEAGTEANPAANTEANQAAGNSIIEEIPESDPAAGNSISEDIPEEGNELGKLNTSDGSDYFAAENGVEEGIIEYGN